MEATAKERIQVAGALQGVDIEVKEFVRSWLLITYDIKADADGAKARRDFLDLCHRAGGIQHTESVYLIPDTPWADVAALEVALAARNGKGKVYIWISQARDDDMGKEITREYDAKVGEIFDETDQRLTKIGQHILDGKPKLAGNMLEHTKVTLDSLEKIAVARGSLALYERWKKLYAKYDAARPLAIFD